jgi:hypothetical protein
MTGVTAISLGDQSAIAGLTVPITVTAADKPSFVTASFSDQVHNTASAINKQITNFSDAGKVNNLQTWSAEAILPESEMLELFPDGDFTKNVQVSVYKGTANVSQRDHVWQSPVKLLTASAVPGAEKITVTVELSPNYVNESLTAQVTVSESGSSASIKPVTLVAVQVGGQASKTLFRGDVTDLELGKEYELHVSVENDHGVSESVNINSVMTSYNPGTVAIDSFDSLDPSGAVFDFTVGAFDYSEYKSLTLLLDYKVGGAVIGSQQSIPIDICGVTNPDAPTANRAYEINRYTMQNVINAGTQFEVVAKLQAVIDVSGLQNNPKTYTGLEAKRTYIMDANMGNPTITLSEIDWVSGAQTVKAVIDGCFNEMTFKFDLSGAESTTTTYDICGTKMTATKVYSYNELNAVGKVVKVSASRPELNGGASVSTSGPAQLAFLLKAVKRAPQPTVAIDFLPNGANTDTKFTFTNIPDLSYSDVFGRVKGENVDRSNDASRDNSGNATITLTDEFEPGARYVAKGHSRFDLDAAGFAERYEALNENSNYLLSAAVESQIAYTGTPELSLAVRPVDASSNELRVVRLSGDMKANDVAELICFARDVCGNLLERRLEVNANSVDSCGNNLSGSSLSDLARDYAHDFVFDKEIEIGNDMFLVGIVDTPNAYDAITVKETADAVATTFKTAVFEYNAAESANNTAQDLSNNPLNDTTYAGYVTAIANYDISLANLTTDISNAILVRDGSDNGSHWFAEQKADVYTRKQAESTNALTNFTNLSQAISLFDTSYASMSSSNQVLYQKSGSITFSTDVYVSQANDASAVPVTVTGTDAVHLEVSLDALLQLYSSNYSNAVTAETNALIAKDAADLAKVENDDIITDKGDEKADLPSRATDVQNRDARATALVTAAATTAATLATKTADLDDARSAFFPTPVVG